MKLSKITNLLTVNTDVPDDVVLVKVGQRRRDTEVLTAIMYIIWMIVHTPCQYFV